jgi:hypothetical protein
VSQDQFERQKAPRERGAFFFRRKATATQKPKSTSHFRANLSIAFSVVALAVSGISVYLQFFHEVNSLKFGMNHAAVNPKLKSLRIIYYVANLGNRPAILDAVAGRVQGIPFQAAMPYMQPMTAETLLYNKPVVLEPGEVLVKIADVCLADLFTVRNSVVLNINVVAFDSHGTYYDYHSDVLRTDFRPGWFGSLSDPHVFDNAPSAMAPTTRVLVSPTDGGEIFQKASMQTYMLTTGLLDLRGYPLSPGVAPINLDPDCKNVLVRDKNRRPIHARSSVTGDVVIGN